ncbi:MAG TPA: C10 family peptidase [Lentimicrobium sp.]|nr:C10 family peptidase [Lentimicrobium sp.]
MKKIITLFLAVLTFAVMANPVDRQLAEQVAVNQYALNAPSNINDFSVASMFETSYEGIVTFYTFTFRSGGFVIIAADDASIPVLAYSYEGTPTNGTHNPIAAAWMESYSKAIVEIRTGGFSNEETLPMWNEIINKQAERSVLDVTPLVTTNWDQGCYYNALCPADPNAGYGLCDHAPTGCVATTMAVLMKYHQWPTTGIGSHSYTDPNYGLQSADFSATTYNYAAMPNSVNTANPAVATLMYHAGVSVNMQYDANSSGAYSEDVPFALCNYFNYAPSTHLESKEDYPSMSEWWALLRTEMDAGRPVYYAGQGTGGGHAWICDGYRLSDNKFHMNWGWSGSSNGYFAIGSLSAGGYSFNDENRIIIGIQPGNNLATWSIQNTHFTAASRGINFIDAVDANVAWASAYDGDGTTSTINEFCKTTDGGVTWVPGQVIGGTTYGIGNICGLDENIAYVALYNGVGNQNNTCGIYKTSNGGLTWTQLPGALQGSASFANNVYFWNEQEGMCHGDVRDGYFEIYTTVNGGMTWQRVPQANITGGVPASGEGGWTSVIATTGENTVMFGTNKGKVYISDDRGFTWRVTNAGITPGTNGGINSIAFTDPMNGIVAQTVAPVSYRKTSDGGATWQTITPTGSIFTNDIAAIPNSNGVYVSTGAEYETPGLMGVSYSTDGGLTWNLFAGTGTKQFLAADFFDASTGYAGGFNTDANNDGMFRMYGTLIVPEGAQITTASSVLDSVPSGELDTIPFSIVNNGTLDLEWSIAFEGAPAWLSASSLSGTVAAGETSDIELYFNATGILPDTLYSAMIITNNSINDPELNIPVTLIITSGVSVRDISFNDHFMVYPNPADNVLTVKGDLEIINLSLLNTSGQVMLQTSVNSKEFASNISNLPAGLYILKLTTSQGIVTSKVNIR